MTQEAIELKKLETQERMQEDKLAHDSREKRKDRIAGYIQSGLKGMGGTAAAAIKAGAINDISFYFKPDELEAVASINTKAIVGTANLSAAGCETNILPGICMLTTVNTIPVCGSKHDAVNSAFRKLYKDIRGRQYGDVAYQYADMAQMILCQAEIYAAYNWLVRTYGLVTADSDPQNRYWTRPILQAEGWDTEELFGPDGRMRLFNTINLVAKAISAWVAPGGFKYFARASMQYSAIYKDSVSSQAQFYFRRPYGFYKFNVKESRAELQTLSSILTVDYVYEQIMDMVNRLFELQSFNKMQSEMMMYFKEDAWVINPISVDFQTMPVYEEYNLSMFKNASYIPHPDIAYLDLHLRQENGALVFTPAIGAPAQRIGTQLGLLALLSAFTKERYVYLEGTPSSEAFVEAIQHAFVASDNLDTINISETDYDAYRIVANSCTLVISVDLVTLKRDGSISKINLKTQDPTARHYAAWSAFHFAPSLILWGSPNDEESYSVIAKPDSFTVLSPGKFIGIAEASATTLFGV